MSFAKIISVCYLCLVCKLFLKVNKKDTRTMPMVVVLVSLLLTLTDIFPLDMLICSLSIFLEYLKNKKPRYNRKINLWLLKILWDHYCYSKIKMVFLTNHSIQEFFWLTEYKSFYPYNRLQILRRLNLSSSDRS